MSIASWVKAAWDRRRWLLTSMRIISQPFERQPFDMQRSITYFWGWVYAAVQLNAKQAASVPLRLYIRKREKPSVYQVRSLDRKRVRYLAGELSHRPSVYVCRKLAEFGAEWEEVTEPHPILRLLADANPIATGIELNTLKHLYLELTGNAYWHVVMDPIWHRPRELWPMPSQWVEVKPGPPGGSVLIQGYRYGITSGQKQDFPCDEVLHFRYPNPGNLYYGLGKVEAGWPAILQNAARHTMEQALYDNGARPDYAVIVKGGSSNTEIDRFETRLKQSFRDARDAGKFVTITGDAQIQPLSWPPHQIPDAIKMLEEISAVTGVPRDKILGNATYANSAQADTGWKRDTVLPMLQLDEEAMNQKYIPLWREYVDPEDVLLAYDNPVPEDQRFILLRNKTALAGNAYMTVNEVRTEDGREPVEGGDDLPKQQSTPFGGGDGNPAVSDQPGTYTVNLAKRHARRHVKGSGYPDRPDQANRRIAPIRAALVRVLTRQRDDALAAMRQVLGLTGKGIKADEAPAGAPDVVAARVAAEGAFEAQTAMLVQELRAALETQLNLGGRLALVDLDIASPFNVQNPAVQTWLDDYTPKLARSITAEGARAIQDALQQGMAEGAGPSQLIERIEAADGFSTDGIRNRAEMIARTESGRAYMQGKIDGWQQTEGLVVGKRWSLAPDACEFCVMAADQANAQDVPLAQPFFRQGHQLVGTERTMSLDYMDVGDAMLHPNCRCDIEPIMAESAV